jgi:poly(3-hydroxybutyrate) depolymerase
MRQGTAVLYPTRPGGSFWTLNRAQGTSDVERVTALRRRRGLRRSRPHLDHRRLQRVRFVYCGCDAGLRVGLLRLSGTDHGWPGAGPPLPDHNPSGVSATSELLRFVRAAQRPA